MMQNPFYFSGKNCDLKIAKIFYFKKIKKIIETTNFIT